MKNTCRNCKFAEYHELQQVCFNIKRFKIKCLKDNMENMKKYGFCTKWEHMQRQVNSMINGANFNLSVWKAPTDLVRLREEIKTGYRETFIKYGKIYIRDTENGECVIVGDVKEAEERGRTA